MMGFLGARALFFIHMPKAGGTSLAGLLAGRFPPEAVLSLRGLDMVESAVQHLRINDFRFVHGHQPFAMAARFRVRPFIYTMLRDPVERAISAFHYMRQEARASGKTSDPVGRAAALALASRSSLAGFVRADPVAAELHLGNQQTRLLSEPYVPGYHPSLGLSLAPLSTADLARARENLLACDCFGLTERATESTELLAHALRCAPFGDLGHANRTLRRPAREALDGETLAMLHELTEHDRALYAFAVDLFEQRRRTALRQLLGLWAAQAGDPLASRAGPALPSEFRFAGPIPGEGWYAPEGTGEHRFSWTGPGAASWLLLGSPPGGEARLEVEVMHALDAGQIDKAALRVNDWPVAREVVAAPAGYTLVARVPASLLRPTGESNRIDLIVEQPTRPCDSDPRNNDSRLLGLAITRVALVPAG